MANKGRWRYPRAWRTSGETDFTLPVQFSATGITSRIDVVDRFPALMNAANQVTVHDLDVVYIEQQSKPGDPDFLDDLHAVIDVVPSVTQMYSFMGWSIARVLSISMATLIFFSSA